MGTRATQGLYVCMFGIVSAASHALNGGSDLLRNPQLVGNLTRGLLALGMLTRDLRGPCLHQSVCYFLRLTSYFADKPRVYPPCVVACARRHGSPGARQGAQHGPPAGLPAV